MQTEISRFINAAQVKGAFGLSHPRLTELVAQGAVKTIKFGSAKQSSRIYSTKDIEHALDQMSLGKMPRRAMKSENVKVGEK
jgi:hypothetical protein